MLLRLVICCACADLSLRARLQQLSSQLVAAAQTLPVDAGVCHSAYWAASLALTLALVAVADVAATQATAAERERQRALADVLRAGTGAPYVFRLAHQCFAAESLSDRLSALRAAAEQTRERHASTEVKRAT